MTVLLTVSTRCDECGKTSPQRTSEAPGDIDTTPAGWTVIEGSHYCSYECALDRETVRLAARIAHRFAALKEGDQ